MVGLWGMTRLLAPTVQNDRASWLSGQGYASTWKERKNGGPPPVIRAPPVGMPFHRTRFSYTMAERSRPSLMVHPRASRGQRCPQHTLHSDRAEVAGCVPHPACARWG